MDSKNKKDFFYKTLASLNQIQQKKKENNALPQMEEELMNALAICSLIRMGEPFELKTIRDTTPSKPMKGALGLILEEVPEVAEETSIIEIHYDQNVYTTSPDLAKRVLGKDYETLILKSAPDSIPAIPVSEKADVIFDLENSVPDSPKEELKEESALINEKAEKEAIDSTNAEFLSNTQIPGFCKKPEKPDDVFGIKKICTFLYAECNYQYVPAGSKPRNICFMIYPLSWHKDAIATDIYVSACSHGIVRAGISKGQSTAVQIEIDHISFIIRGSWKEGAFEAIITPMQDLSAMNPEMSIRYVIPNPDEETSTTYVHAGNGVYIFPAKIGENESNGLALASIAISQNDSILILCPTAEGTFVIGNGTTIETYWQGDEFIYGPAD